MKTVLIRVAEWSAWLPMYPDPNDNRLQFADGVTGFEMADDEKLLECAVTSTGGRKHFPMEKPPENEGDEPTMVNVQHGLYVFQSVIAKEAGEGEIPQSPVNTDTGQKLIVPGAPNRAARRNNSGGKRKR